MGDYLYIYIITHTFPQVQKVANVLLIRYINIDLTLLTIRLKSHASLCFPHLAANDSHGFS
jgi:hypothetical protein